LSRFSEVSRATLVLVSRGILGQQVLEVVEGLDAPVAAGLNDGEEDGATLAAYGVADEDQFFLPKAVGRMAFCLAALTLRAAVGRLCPLRSGSTWLLSISRRPL